MNEGVEDVAVGGRAGGGNYSSYEIVIKTLWGWKAASKAFTKQSSAPAPGLLISIGKHFSPFRKFSYNFPPKFQSSAIFHKIHSDWRKFDGIFLLKTNFPRDKRRDSPFRWLCNRGFSGRKRDCCEDLVTERRRDAVECKVTFVTILKCVGKIRT